MAVIKKNAKKKFAEVFMIIQNGNQAMRAAGIEPTIPNLQKLLCDETVRKYIDENADLVRYALGTTKAGHLAKLERLFSQATGETKSRVWKFTKDGDFVYKDGKFINYTAAASLSQVICKLNDWEETEDTNIEIDLKIDESLFNTKENEETEEERDDKVFAHFKSEGVI